MADYIYLLQNRLTPAQWRALEAVREAARTQGMPVFLVGGAVRDLTSGAPVRDLDFAVQGDPHALTGDLENARAMLAGENKAFGSIFLTFRGGVRVEIGPTVSVTYSKPGQPETQPAVILDDLRRRDFTANAMAVSLNEGSYGLLLDPLNGTADIENRELRLVSAYGFIEQPALLLRAARLTERLGFTLEERTQTRYENSKEEGHIEALPEFDRGYELEEIFHEEDPLSVLDHLAAEGWRDALFPGLNIEGADRKGIDEVRDLIGQLEGQKLHPDPSAVFFPLITAKLSDENRAALKQRFARPGFVQQIETMEVRGKELASQLTAKTAAAPSDTWRLLMEADPEVVLYLAFHSRSGAVQSKLKAFLKEWPQMRQKLPYSLMQEMRITPDLPGYDKLLEDLFFALIDGKLDTPEATRAFLEPFSPPAPPQVTVRRRPAKATRSRSKRAAEAVTEAPESSDDSDTGDDGDEEDQDDDMARAGASLADDDDEEEEADDESSDERKDRPQAGRDTDDDDDEDSKPEPRPRPAKKVAAKAAPAKAPAPAPAKQVSSKVAAKTAERAAPAKVSAPAKAEAKAVPAKVTPAPAPAKKIPAKTVVVAKAPAKVAVKQPAVAAKAPATKAVAAKQPVKAVPVKVAVKKVAAKAQASAPAKATPPAKAVKKVAAKGRTGR